MSGTARLIQTAPDLRVRLDQTVQARRHEAVWVRFASIGSRETHESAVARVDRLELVDLDDRIARRDRPADTTQRSMISHQLPLWFWLGENKKNGTGRGVVLHGRTPLGMGRPNVRSECPRTAHSGSEDACGWLTADDRGWPGVGGLVGMGVGKDGRLRTLAGLPPCPEKRFDALSS
jgi:hypothetical protein